MTNILHTAVDCLRQTDACWAKSLHIEKEKNIKKKTEKDSPTNTFNLR